MAQPSCIISKTPIRHVADFKGKKIRVFASQFQTEAFDRLGATPVAMTLGDVLPALQQGAIDGAIAGIGPFVHLHFHDAAKYVTEINQPAIFIILEVSQKWYDTLPKDLQEIVDRDGAAVSKAINPAALKPCIRSSARPGPMQGGELISLPPDEQASMMQIVVQRRRGRVEEQAGRCTRPTTVVADAAKRAAAAAEPVM